MLKLTEVSISVGSWVLAAFVLISLNARAAEATLEIVADKERLSYSQSQLLSRRDLQTLSTTDSEYKQRLTKFKAIPIADLLAGLTIPELAVVQFNSSDGFSANLERSRLFSADPKASKAFLAIEDPGNPWPQLGGKASFSGSVLPPLDESPGIRDRAGGMALSNRLNPYSVGRTERVSRHVPCRRCRAECSKRIQVLPEELFCVPQNERQWDGIDRAGLESSQESD